MRYGVIGWYGHKNLGDEILLNCILDCFGRRQAIVFTTDPMGVKAVKENHGVESSKIQTIPEHDIDFLMFGGGDVFHNLTVEWYFPKSLIDKIQCPILMLSVGVPFGEGHSPLSKSIDHFVKRVDFIGFRDAYSQKIFSDLWDKDSFLLPDLAFLVKKQSVKRRSGVVLQVRKVPKSYSSITPKNFNQIARKQFAELDSKLREKGLNPKFLVFNPKDTEVLPDNCESISCFDNVSLAIKEISSSEALIGTSLHSCIIALTQDTPFKAYRYQGKIDAVVGMICNRNQIIYPKNILEFDAFYPVEELSNEERKNVSLIRSYLKSSLNIIRKAAMSKDFRNINLPEFPIPQHVSETYQFSEFVHKPKFLRDLRDWFYSRIGIERQV